VCPRHYIIVASRFQRADDSRTDKSAVAGDVYFRGVVRSPSQLCLVRGAWCLVLGGSSLVY
jgi:hypothetical protein